MNQHGSVERTAKTRASPHREWVLSYPLAGVREDPPQRNRTSTHRQDWRNGRPHSVHQLNSIKDDAYAFETKEQCPCQRKERLRSGRAFAARPSTRPPYGMEKRKVRPPFRLEAGSHDRHQNGARERTGTHESAQAEIRVSEGWSLYTTFPIWMVRMGILTTARMPSVLGIGPAVTEGCTI